MPNQRVSLEEVRAKRLAKEAEEGKPTDNQGLIPIPPDESRPEPTAPLEAQQLGQSPDAQSPVKASPEPAPAAAPSTVAASPTSTPANLDEFLASLTVEQLQRVRTLATAKGLAPATSSGSVRLPDGSLQVTVTLEPMIVEQLSLWAEGDGVGLEEEARKRILESLQNYLYGDWSAVVEQPLVAATTTTTTTTATK
jgi:hypothetical protein